MPTEHDEPSCTACPLDPERRAFLREAAAATAAALLALGASPAAAATARALAFVEPLHASGDERTYPIPAADGATIDRDAEVILARWQGFVYAFNLACPHKNTALRWLGPEQRFQCPKHKSKYRPDGSFISGRATRGMDRLAVRRQGDTVVVNLGALFKQSEKPAEWEGAKVAL
jgi:Rieske Fe-S protein